MEAEDPPGPGNYEAWLKLAAEHQQVSRYIVHFNPDEWLSFDKKPEWYL